MATTHEAANKETFKRFQDVTNTQDPELISETIDEIADPDLVTRTPLPVEAAGAVARKEVVAKLHQVFPDLQVTSRTWLRKTTRSPVGTRCPGPPGRVHGHPRDRDVGHIRRDLHIPLRGRPHRRDMGSRRPLDSAAINPIDWKAAQGAFREQIEAGFPLVLGFDGAGRVERHGPGAHMPTRPHASDPGARPAP